MSFTSNVGTLIAIFVFLFLAFPPTLARSYLTQVHEGPPFRGVQSFHSLFSLLGDIADSLKATIILAAPSVDDNEPDVFPGEDPDDIFSS